MRLFLISSALLLATAANAQTLKLTSPKGLAKVEGNTVFFHWGASVGRRFQSIDNTNTGGPFPARKLALRRNGGGGGTGAGARTMDLTLTMAQTHFGVVYGEFDRNLATNKRVVHKNKINFPDWTANAGSPAPFDWVIPFTAPWIYLGQTALVWDAHYVHPSVTTLAQTDRDYTPYRQGPSSVIGPGCGNFLHSVFLQNNGPALREFAMRLECYGNGPKTAPVILLLDVQDRNLTIPGLCSKLHATLFLLPLGVTSATGAVTPIYMSFPYRAGLQGAKFVTQLAFFDPTQPGIKWAVSNGLVGTMPTSTATTGHQACYIWATNPRTSGLVFTGGTVVAQLSL